MNWEQEAGGRGWVKSCLFFEGVGKVGELLAGLIGKGGDPSSIFKRNYINNPPGIKLFLTF